MKTGIHVHAIKASIEKAPAGHFPVGYWCKGVLIDDVVVGKPIHIARYARAAQEEGEAAVVSRLGEYQSSPVVAVDAVTPNQLQVRTQNSVWLLTNIGPLNEETSKMLNEMMEYVSGSDILSRPTTAKT